MLSERLIRLLFLAAADLHRRFNQLCLQGTVCVLSCFLIAEWPVTVARTGWPEKAEQMISLLSRHVRQNCNVTFRILTNQVIVNLDRCIPGFTAMQLYLQACIWIHAHTGMSSSALLWP